MIVAALVADEFVVPFGDVVPAGAGRLAPALPLAALGAAVSASPLVPLAGPPVLAFSAGLPASPVAGIAASRSVPLMPRGALRLTLGVLFAAPCPARLVVPRPVRLIVPRLLALSLRFAAAVCPAGLLPPLLLLISRLSGHI